MLEVVRGAGVSDVAAVVTRWFGGTLERDLVTEFAITLDHGSAGRVESELRARGLVVRDAAYGDRVLGRRSLSRTLPGAEERPGPSSAC